jgi:hypothetical protein
MMLPEPAYSAAVCLQCSRTLLVLDDDAQLVFCAICGASALLVPGTKFDSKELPLFTELERIVHAAELSKSEATLIAGELEGVGLHCEPPETVLRHISPRLNGLQAAYDPKQEHSRLLLVVGMLLTIVCARMIGSAPTRTRSSPPSGMRRASGVRHTAEQAAVLRRKSG